MLWAFLSASPLKKRGWRVPQAVTVHKSYASFSSRARCLCVCECVWACRLISADQRSSWFNHHHHQLQLITPPLNTHHFLISFVRSLFVSPGCVWSRLHSSLVPSSFLFVFLFVFLWICHSGFVTSHQHFSSRHSSDHRSPCATTLSVSLILVHRSVV